MSRSESKTISQPSTDPLQRKKGIPSDKPPTILRNIVQRQEDDYKESKPFHKKYGNQQATSKQTIPD